MTESLTLVSQLWRTYESMKLSAKMLKANKHDKHKEMSGAAKILKEWINHIDKEIEAND